MNRRYRSSVIALLYLAGPLSASDASAQPRMEPTLESVTVPTPPQDVWLRRLVGNFTLDGVFSLGNCAGPGCAAITGNMNCIAVGDGPGVHCIINAKWTLFLGSPPVDFSSFLDPAVGLFGLDPGKSEINLMMVNDKGLPTSGFGIVKGHTARFRNRCPGANDDGCQVGIIIEAKPDANINYMWVGEGMVMSMRRISVEGG